MIKAYLNWSGGKDSSLCLYRILQNTEYSVQCLLTSMNRSYNRVSMHGVRRELLEAQASSIGIQLETVELPEQPGMIEYEQAMHKAVASLKSQGFVEAIFGDIFLEDLRHYREQNLLKLDMTCAFPLWQIPTKQLMQQFISRGFKAIIVCVNEKYLDRSFCGRLIDDTFVNDLPPEVDVCGENGEYHSFVFDGPIFRQPVPFTKGDVVYRHYDAPRSESDVCNSADQPSTYGFYFCDLFLSGAK